MTDTFQLGHVYWATPVHKKLSRRVVIMIGRGYHSVQFAFVDDLRSADVQMFGRAGFDREFCKIRSKDHDYNCSSACELPAAEAAEIYEAINSRPRS